MGCGIYKIQNIIDGKIYIGSSINLSKRLQNHKIMLSGGYHDNRYLQNSVTKYGIDSFIFEIIELCGEDELVKRENHFIDFYKSNETLFGYNLAKVCDTRRNIFNHEVKVKMSKVKIEKNKNFNRFKLINIDNGFEVVFDNLVDAARFLISNNFTKSKENKVRDMLSICLRNKIVNNGTNNNGSIRKTIYKHKWEILN